MDQNVIATSRASKYLKILEDKNSKSHQVYMRLMELLKSGHVEGKTTMADLLLVAFSELGYMCKSSKEGLDSKGPELDKDGNVLVHDKKNNKYAKFFEDHDKNKPMIDKFYMGSKQGEDWCAVFVHWIMFNVLGEQGTRKATNIKKRQNHGAGVEYDYWYYLELPQTQAMFLNHHLVSIGDQAFFCGPSGIFHTGIVVGVHDGYVYIMEGNTNPQVGDKGKIVPEGKGVCLKRYPIDRMDIEYCRPLYKGIVPAPKGFSWSMVNKLIAELNKTLRMELEQALTPEEMFEEEPTKEETEKTRLQSYRNKIKVVKNIMGMGRDYVELSARTLKDIKDVAPSVVKKAKDGVIKHLK
jgi:hypothetical protein